MRARRRFVWLVPLAVACGHGAGDASAPPATSTPPASDAGAHAPGATLDAGAPPPPSFPDTLGGHYDAAGDLVRFRVFSSTATRLEVDLYAQPIGSDETLRYTLVPDTQPGVWTATVSVDALEAAGIVGAVYYGYRAWGPNWPYDASWQKGTLAGFVTDVDANGNRFDPNKLLLDPYAEEVSHDPYSPDQPSAPDYSTGAADRTVDTGPLAPKGIVLATDTTSFGTRPTRALKDDIVYEVHVRGLTMQDPTVPAALQGTYAGAALKAPYLADLGVTAIELLPVYETQNDDNDEAAAQSTTLGMNYWGYASVSYFAPDRRYASDKSAGGPTRELKALVKAMHDAGIKVFLDVVYNHTGEGGVSGSDPTVAKILSWRGLDNATYYELGADHATPVDDTGTGGNFNTATAASRNMILDSLQHFQGDVGIDGFRFDLAPVLANSCASLCFQYDPTDPANALNRAAAELPVRPAAGGNGVDLVAEPWGIGPGTYQQGHLPAGWAEWNGLFRDDVREAQNELATSSISPGDLATRFGGSPDLFASSGRKPWHSVNYVASHDGFCLRDVYSYDAKENDQPWPFGPSPGGDDANNSWNQNGDTGQEVQADRTGLALVMLAAGVPMITGGDEMYRTQYGNNNPYNLDSDRNWLDWSLLTSEASLQSFARALIHFREAHPVLRPADFLDGADHDGNGLKNVTFYRADGTEADATYLGDATQHFLAVRLDGAEASGGADPFASILFAYDAAASGVAFTLPANLAGKAFYVAGDSGAGVFAAPGSEPPATSSLTVGARSVAVIVEK